jgi:hypothetical protein
MTRSVGIIISLLLLPAALHAQAPRFNVQFQAIEFETGSSAKMAAYGLLTGAAGFVVGGLLGAALVGEYDSSDSWVGALQGAIVGGTIGESLMLPVGVHLANDRRGDLLVTMPTSLAIGAAGAWIGRRLDRTGHAWPVLVLTPIAQLAASIGLERHTAN